MPQDALKELPIQSVVEALGTKGELENILLESRLDTVSAEATSNLLKYVEAELPNLQKLRSWWDSIQGVTEITPVGAAIAFSNAKRLDPLEGFPSLSEMLGFS